MAALEEVQDLTIRAADVCSPQARNALTSYFAELDQLLPEGFDLRRIDLEPFRPPTGGFVLATSDAQVVGCVALQRDDDVATARHLWVRPAWRGRGLGARLLAALEDEARSLGARTVRLDTHRAMPEAAALVRRAGYHEVPAFNHDPYAHLWFARALPAAGPGDSP